MTTFLQRIVETCCRVHFKSIDPKKVRFHLTKSSKKGKMMRILSTKRGIIVIQIDKKFANNADEAVLTAKVAHQLAHAKLKLPENSSLENEKAVETEVRKFFSKWLKR
jgi:hypothetical protein